MQRHAEPAGVFDAAQVQDLGAGGGQFQHFLAGDRVDLLGGGNHARVGGVDAVHVGVDLADVGFQGGGQGHGGGVRAAAAQGGDFVGGAAHALEPGHDGDVALVQGRADAVRIDVDDARLAVDAVGDHAGLGAGEGLGGGAELVDGHGQQGHGDAFAGGEEHVHFAGGGGVGDLAGEVQEFVGGVAHGGDHHDHFVAGPLGVHHALGDALDAVGVRNGGTAELLHDQLLGDGSAVGQRPAAALRACTSVVGVLMRVPSLDQSGFWAVRHGHSGATA